MIAALERVNKKYADNEVLTDFSMSIGEGEMVAVTGPSGSGKSTILNIVGLLESPDSGSVLVGGERNIKPNSRRGTLALRNTIGYLFQNCALVDDATVSYNLDIALAYSGAPKRDWPKRKALALEEAGLDGGFLGRKVYGLSGGEQQRVAISRLLLKPCGLVLADEPTGALDAGNRDAVIALLSRMRDSGKSVLVASHDPVVAESCDRAIALSGNARRREPAK
jgi:putative ABC transport system ATP-binding protein